MSSAQVALLTSLLVVNINYHFPNCTTPIIPQIVRHLSFPNCTTPKYPFTDLDK